MSYHHPSEKEHKKNIADAIWFNEASVRKILNTLNNSGYGEARFVGGCVRNTLLGASVTDVDIATTLIPEDVMNILAREGVTVIPTGLKHGTVTAIYAEQKFEITTLRKDVATDGRHAEIVYTDKWEEDAGRRDFTMNALYADAQGNIYDYFGGIEDLQNRHVRFIGDARQRIHEDVLRILRYFRFQSTYGTLEYNEESLNACAELAHLIPNLSGERIREEVIKILSSPLAVPTLEKMKQTGVLAFVLPEAKLDRVFECFTANDTNHKLNYYSIGRLAALIPPTAIGEVSDRLRLSNFEKQFLLNFHDALALVSSVKNHEKVLYQFGREIFFQASLYRACLNDNPKTFETLYANYKDWRKPTFPLSGKDLLLHGIKPGKEMGDILKQTEEWWLENNARPKYDECLAHAKTLF